ncbi:unnamed protein product [Boreogadus saida]
METVFGCCPWRTQAGPVKRDTSVVTELHIRIRDDLRWDGRGRSEEERRSHRSPRKQNGHMAIPTNRKKTRNNLDFRRDSEMDDVRPWRLAETAGHLCGPVTMETRSVTSSRRHATADGAVIRRSSPPGHQASHTTPWPA